MTTVYNFRLIERVIESTSPLAMGLFILCLSVEAIETMLLERGDMAQSEPSVRAQGNRQLIDLKASRAHSAVYT